MNVKVQILAACMIIISGCTDKTPRDENTSLKKSIPVDVTIMDYIPYDSLVSSIEFIPLETNTNCFVDEITDVVFGKEVVLINSFRQPVYCFDKNGNFKFKLGDLGIGPGEYQEINGISVENGYIYMYDSRSGTMIIYDEFSGDYIRQLRFPFIYAKAYVLNGYVYASEFLDKYRLVSFPLNNLKAVKELYYSKETLLGNYKFRKKITRSDNRLFWTNPLTGDIYELEDGNMIQFISLDFGMNALPSENLKEKVKEPKNAQQIGDFLIADSIIHLTYYYNEEQYTCLFDFSSRRIFNMDLLKYMERFRGKLNFAIQKLPFVSYESDGWFYELLQPYGKFFVDKTLSPKYETYKRLENLSEDSNPYIVRYKFRLSEGRTCN